MNKLRGGSNSPLTQLKGLVHSKIKLREEIWSWNKETVSNAAIRDRIKALCGIELKRDSQVSTFWAWLSLLMQEGEEFRQMANADYSLLTAGRRRRARWVLSGKVSKRAIPLSKFLCQATGLRRLRHR